MTKNDLMGCLAVKKKKNLDADCIKELTGLIYAADSIRNAEVLGESVMTVDVAFLTEQCKLVAEMYSK